MSRVEADDRSEQKRDAERRQPVDRTPSKAEGDEETVNEALRNDEEKNNRQFE